MIKRVIVLILIFLCNIVPSPDANENNNTEKILKVSSCEVNSREVLLLSIEAIDRCFENIASGKKTKNFPDNPGPMNHPFPISKDYNYDHIVGYEFVESDPKIVTFFIGVDGVMGLHIAVVIDIEKMEVVRVYNRPGS